MIQRLSNLKLTYIVGAVSLGAAGLFWIGANHRTEHSRQVSPSGGYTAICSFKSYLTSVGMTPGSSSDKPCFVKIVDSSGKNCGEIPVPMIHMAGVEWNDHGAEITLVGEWDFKQGTCYYWSEDQNSQIFVKR